jgi:hypothetical protein
MSAELIKSVVDANVYLTLATVDENDQPWASPVFFAAFEIYPGPPERGGRRFEPADVRPPSPYRLYRATASQHWVLCPRETGQPCEPHGKMFDHRLAVSL